MPTDDIVVLKDVKKAFGEAEILKGIDMVCRKDQTTCIVGGSGAGKTTLLRLIVALERPTSGHIYIAGEDTVPMGERELFALARVDVYAVALEGESAGKVVRRAGFG